MHTFLADRLARVAKDWQQNLAALKELSAINMALFEASLQYWQVGLGRILLIALLFQYICLRTQDGLEVWSIVATPVSRVQ